MADTSTYI